MRIGSREEDEAFWKTKPRTFKRPSGLRLDRIHKLRALTFA